MWYNFMINDFKKIELPASEYKLIENGWGNNVANCVDVYNFYYNSEGNNVNGYLAYPKNVRNKLPVIIWNRGGNSKSGLLDDFLAHGILGEIASWGYVVFASQYRKNDEFGGNDVNDIINLIKISKEFEFSDGNIIGMEGWSRGGMMSYLTLTKTDEIKACIVVAGLSDLPGNETNNPKLGEIFKLHFGLDDKSEFDKSKKKRSAVYWPDKISKSTKILFIHGASDEKILTEDSSKIYKMLSEINGKSNYELIIINGGDHYLRKHRKEVSFLRKKWFDENLKFMK
jgi:dipeptidyl aminopeptidase/acylaminoacyl peptidase